MSPFCAQVSALTFGWHLPAVETCFMWFQRQRFLIATAFAVACFCYLNFVPITRVWASGQPRPAPANFWVYPASSTEVVRDFLSPNGDYSAGHRGIDFAAVEGESALAVADGVVRFAGSVAGRGVVSIDLADGYTAEVEPVCPLVATGDSVMAGQEVATVCSGDVGHCSEICLHLSARRFSAEYSRGFGYLSPLLFLGAFAPSHLVAIGSLD